MNGWLDLIELFNTETFFTTVAIYVVIEIVVPKERDFRMDIKQLQAEIHDKLDVDHNGRVSVADAALFADEKLAGRRPSIVLSVGLVVGALVTFILTRIFG